MTWVCPGAGYYACARPGAGTGDLLALGVIHALSPRMDRVEMPAAGGLATPNADIL